MKQATVKLTSGEWIIREVHGINIRGFMCNGRALRYKEDVEEQTGITTIKLPFPGNWQLLGADPTNLAEQEAGEIVESWPSVSGEAIRVYQRYPDEIPKCRTAIASLSSLAASLGIEKPFVVLRKNIEK